MNDSTTLEFELNGHVFRAQRLNAKQQFHLSRRLAPLLPPLARLLVARTDLSTAVSSPMELATTMVDLLRMLELAEPLATALATMRDEDADKIFELTLGSVKVRTSANGDAWMPLWTNAPGGGLTPLAELNDFASLAPIILRVVGFNLGNFTKGFLTSREEEPSPIASGAPSRVAKIG
jgi:hypothetical protein